MRSDNRKGSDDGWGNIEGDRYHRIRDTFDSEVKVMIPCDKGSVESGSVDRDVDDS